MVLLQAIGFVCLTSEDLFCLVLFHRCSNPTPHGRSDPVLGVEWTPLSSSNVSDPVPYLDINGNLEVKRDPETNRLRFWDDMYERYNGPLL